MSTSTHTQPLLHFSQKPLVSFEMPTACINSNTAGVRYDFIFKDFILFIFRQRGREGEREGEEHQCVVASHVPPTGDLACNPGMCPDWELNQRPFGLQARAQSTEPHQPGQI